MLRPASFGLVLFLGLLGSAAHADPFTINLVARAGKEQATAVNRTADAKPQPRAILIAERAVPITVQWTVRHAAAIATAKDVLVHCFVVRQEKPDQPQVPKLTKNVALESALTMDFRPRDRTEGAFTLTIPQAGCYLIRLELKGTADKGEPEPFAALDLVVR